MARMAWSGPRLVRERLRVGGGFIVDVVGQQWAFCGHVDSGESEVNRTVLVPDAAEAYLSKIQEQSCQEWKMRIAHAAPRLSGQGKRRWCNVA